ncbi:MAG: GDP-L-fucose synthase [Thermodesulfobacteriota bacterium]
MSFWNEKKVLVTGGTGFVGHNVVKLLKTKDCKEIFIHSSNDYDLTVETEIDRLFRATHPEIVIHLAGKVGGIGANKEAKGEFFYKNVMMGTLVLEYARRYNVMKTIALAAGCGYPKHLEGAHKESDFWSGLPDENSIGYSMAKKMLIIQSWTYREQYGFDSTILLPANLYGPWDNFNLETCHVVPALIRKFVEAQINSDKQVIVWGSGTASREFLYVDDTAKVIIDSVEKLNKSGPFNLGTGIETTIKKLAETIKEISGFKGEIVWDTSRPEGQSKKYYDMSLLKKELGYVPSTALEKGLKKTLDWYKKHRNEILKNEKLIQKRVNPVRKPLPF